MNAFLRDGGLSVGCIGCGNMGAAVMRGLCAHDSLRLIGHDHTRAKVDALNSAENPGRVVWAETPEALAQRADIVILAVKPHQIAETLAGIRPCLNADKIVVSLAAAVSVKELKQSAGGVCPVARLMPNLPARVGKGAFALCLDDEALSEVQKRLLQDLFKGMGLLLVLPDSRFSAFSSVAGCGPAFVCQFIEALADGGVACGLPRQKALLYAAQTLRGTARLMLDTGAHPGAMKDAVCSPAGSTIAGVQVLERRALRGAVMDAVAAAAQKNAALGQS